MGVRGSIPRRSTAPFALAGYIAGEGYFTVKKTKRLHISGEPVEQFEFGLQVSAEDTALLASIRSALGGGSIRHQAPRRAHWKPTATYSLKSIKAHVTATIPFMEEFLYLCAKRVQFETWRDRLQAYVVRHDVNWGMGRSTCSIDGCDGLVRGRGLCRSHYYRETGW